MFKKRVLKEDFQERQNDFWKLQAKFESVCKLLGIGFAADSYDPEACFIDKSKTLSEKLK